MHRARGGGDEAATLARIGQHATNVRLTILIAVLECFSAFVLAVTLYGITRDEDHELAMLGLVCRVAEGVLGSINNVPGYLGLLWLAKGGGRDRSRGRSHNERAARVPADAWRERPSWFGLLCRREFDLFLSAPARTDGPGCNRIAGRVRVGPARGGVTPAARRFLDSAVDRIRTSGCRRSSSKSPSGSGCSSKVSLRCQRPTDRYTQRRGRRSAAARFRQLHLGTDRSG